MSKRIEQFEIIADKKTERRCFGMVPDVWYELYDWRSSEVVKTMSQNCETEVKEESGQDVLENVWNFEERLQNNPNIS